MLIHTWENCDHQAHHDNLQQAIARAKALRPGDIGLVVGYTLVITRFGPDTWKLGEAGGQYFTEGSAEEIVSKAFELKQR